MAGDSLLVACMLSKYQQHMPIYRQASAIYSLIQTCLLNEVRPQDYFMALLPQLPAVRRGDIDAATLLPQHFKD